MDGLLPHACVVDVERIVVAPNSHEAAIGAELCASDFRSELIASREVLKRDGCYSSKVCLLDVV